MLARILAILAILAVMAVAAPAASAAPDAQRHGAGVHVGHGTWGHHVGHPIVRPWGFRGFGPGFGLAPFLPVVALPPPVVPVAVPVSVPVSVPYAPPQVNYAPALPAAPCGCSPSP
jgi:hypothetical protein